jgi:4-amino-4-deoxy-L-arabinose transferase-like glycosyltransferase
MRTMTWSERLWGPRSQFIYLFIAAIVMLFTLLGVRELWTQEHRWADIVFAMMHTGDYLHPSLEGMEYYDKPLFSYWLIVALATVMGKLTVWVLRVPSALAGLLAIWSIYRLGTVLKNKSLGLMAGWLLLTTFYFIFWARTSSADMLNMAGTLFGVTWYFMRKDRPGFVTYSVFFLILAVTALCKGLVGPVVAVLAVLPDLLVQSNWKKHLRLSLILGMIPAAIVYMFPFWASTYFSAAGYSQNGLYLVYRENILRYFHPFDHKDPIYTYLIYLPIYTLPWAFFFVPALVSLKSRWRAMTWNSKWMVWSVLVLFLFFTFSGSRRGYYVLPLVPFALLVTADWILSGAETARRYIWAGRVAALFFVMLFLNFGVIQPFYYAQSGLADFANELQTKAEKVKPWSEWQIILLDPESKLRFYLQIPPTLKNYAVTGPRDHQTHEGLLQAWPVLKNKPKNVIFITRSVYVPLLQQDFADYEMISVPESWVGKMHKKQGADEPVAFIPKNK